MTRSMTAYARAKSKEIEGLSWVVELHSINRKHLDIHLHISRELLFLDLELRKEISKVLHRGSVTAKISFTKGKETLAPLSLLKKLKTQFTKVAKELHLPVEEISLTFLLEQLERISFEGELRENIQTQLKKTLKKALQELIKMKETEGRLLASDIEKRLNLLETILKEIEKESVKSPEKYQKKLQERLSQLFEEIKSDERVLKEIALFAEKIDITEEITRLQSHLKQSLDLLISKKESVGKTLDFITQEMLREINTIGSKSPSLIVTKRIIEAKAELEKIREQVQNIE